MRARVVPAALVVAPMAGALLTLLPRLGQVGLGTVALLLLGAGCARICVTNRAGHLPGYASLRGALPLSPLRAMTSGAVPALPSLPAPDRSLAVPSARPEAETVERTDAGAFRFARGLYYAGIALMSVLTIRLPLSLTFSDVLFAAAAALVLWEIAVSHSPERVWLPGSIVLGSVLFLCGGMISSALAAHAIASTLETAKFFYLTTVWFALGAIVLRTSRQIRTALSCWVISAAVTSTAALIQAAHPGLLHTPQVGIGRFNGFGTQLNDLGVAAGIAILPALIPLAEGWRVSNLSKRLINPLWLVCIGLVLSGSFGGLSAAVVAVAAFAVFYGVTRKGLLIGGALFLLLAVGSQVPDRVGLPSPQDQLARVTGGNAQGGNPIFGGTLEQRLDIGRKAISRSVSSPVIGVGFDVSDRLIDNRLEPHNIFLLHWYEGGIFALAGITVMLIGILAVGRANLGSADPEVRFLGTILLASFVGFVAVAQTQPVFYQRYDWIIAALIIALSRARRREPCES